jgi:hypothetical protein
MGNDARQRVRRLQDLGEPARARLLDLRVVHLAAQARLAQRLLVECPARLQRVLERASEPLAQRVAVLAWRQADPFTCARLAAAGRR